MEYVGGGVDYNSGPYTIQFDVGVIRALFDVSVNNDNISEGDETFNLKINAQSLPDSVTIGDPGQTTVTILTNDGKHKVCDDFYVIILYFVWADQRDKVCLIFHIVGFHYMHVF